MQEATEEVADSPNGRRAEVQEVVLEQGGLLTDVVGSLAGRGRASSSR
jgi:hypothetical protein